jgi:hypothetical protein
MIYLLFLLVWAPIGAILNGTAIQLCWKFFLAPVFHGLDPTITFVQALGLGVVATALTTSLIGADADAAANEGVSAAGQVIQTLARGLTYYAVLFLSIAIVHALQP